MADHDRDAGSRGEEEAPRDPTPSETTTRHPAQDPAGDRPDDERERLLVGLRYGQAAGSEPPGATRTAPGSHQDYLSNAHTMPGLPAYGAPPRSDSFRDFVRQKPAQIIGAGLLGLVLGALIGGTTVAVVSNLGDRDDVRPAYWEEYPGFGHRREGVYPYPQPQRIEPSCRPGPDGVYCVAPPYVVPKPVPTMSVAPPPTPTFTAAPTRTG
ncbi:hypothetical protein [Nonomuraea zeae]|uniref:Uncharacterized protein n=1 Tax=Nonomuraea zeae TaxID=1642303 RepID=A0A5S4GXR5_9ACTN|nr:hypothetical protein [Nonomuraea zeae]TMR37758.1 hypothetical protein ETD85_07030 [Nonomuraea zeae]